MTANARAAVDAPLNLTPEQDEATLRDAGFSRVSLFCAGFTFRGWVTYAGGVPQNGNLRAVRCSVSLHQEEIS